MQQLAGKLVSWLREQVNGAGAHGVVVGMSGGVDSSVAAVPPF
jgi:NH3-dependent NAD+ synthetase